jgi:hypothetical protein
MMSDKIDWTKNLGDAVLAQQPDVMDAIQRLRSKAQANNKLVTTKQQKVSVQTQESKQVIVIEQTDPNTVYVPYYDPATVYGAWRGVRIGRCRREPRRECSISGRRSCARRRRVRRLQRRSRRAFVLGQHTFALSR